MQKKKSNNMILLAGVILLALIPILIVKQTGDEEIFAGADGQAVEVIKKINPDYEPWASSLWEPPSGEIESLLFVLQAAIGAGFLGYYFGVRRGRMRKAGAQIEHASD